MGRFLGDLFNSNEWHLKEKVKRVQRILAMEEELGKLTDEELKGKTKEFKDRLRNGESLDDLLEEAFAVVREASFRVLNMRHFPVQLVGGIILHEGNIAEMKTGEGKTLVSTLPAYLNALTEQGVFIITVNEYLAARDREEMGQVHEFLGLSVGLIQSQMELEERKAAYACDITYGTNSEFGFDYLRDNMVVVKENRVQRKLNYAILDEVDLILIDDARTPLIITGPGNRPSNYYVTVDKFVKSLIIDEDYEYDADSKMVSLLDTGMDKAEIAFDLDNIADSSNTELLHHIRQSLQANYIMKKDQDYVVKDGEIQIVDKYTGRLLPGRRYSSGLHQALEAKENLEIQKEAQTMATITYQNFFRMFEKISGMTGTAYTERLEIKSIYGMDVVVVPTNKPMVRIDNDDIVFKTEAAKFKAIADEVELRYEKGQPVLIGTVYIDKSEQLSRLLEERNIPHKLLNAMQDKNEAEIISLAGQRNSITIATNMAGRGTDIKLADGVAELGGLLVIGTERHEARRIDNQLRGRSGRQGDPGESQFFISLEDSLFEKLGKEKVESMKKMAEKLGFIEDEPLKDKILSKAIESTQKNIEDLNYRIRKSTMDFDQILNKQRETIYSERNKILNGDDMSDFIKSIIKEMIVKHIKSYTSQSPYAENWDLQSLQSELHSKFSFTNRVDLSSFNQEELVRMVEADLVEMITEEAMKIYQEREEEIQAKQLRYTERLILMKNIDAKWMEHLDVVEQIRQGINVQSVGRQDPVREFNKEAAALFETMLDEIKQETIRLIFALRRRSGSEEQKTIVNITDEQIREKLEILEEKYKVTRKQLFRIPANLPVIGFNMNINALEEVEVEIGLYYLEKGVEERLKAFDRKMIVKGIFQAIFEKPEQKDWEMGWYAAKAFVAGQEASTINFLITEAIDLKEMERRKQAGNRVNSNIKFFSNRNPAITFDLGLKDSGKDRVKVAIAFNGDKEKLNTFEIPVYDERATVTLDKPESGWNNGLYEFLLLDETKKLSIPFMIVDEFDRHAEQFDIPIKVLLKEGKGKDFVAQLMYLETKQDVIKLPLKVNQSGAINLGLKRQGQNWKIGRYEFRLLDSEKVILTKHFLVS